MIYNNIASVLALASGMGSSIDTSVPLSERLAIGLELLIVGMGTVFAILLILWGVLALFKVVFYDMKNKSEDKPAEVKEAAPTATAAAPVPEPVQPAAQTDDGELIAAITAAVAAYLDAEAQADGLPQCDTKFRVVSFRRAGRR